MAKKENGERSKPRRLSLQVPQDVNLAKMSDEEVERLALDMSRKMASTMPKGSVINGVEGVTLNQQSRAGVGVDVSWTRYCDRAELSREGLVVNPEIFAGIVTEDDIAGKSARIISKRAGKTASKKNAKKKK